MDIVLTQPPPSESSSAVDKVVCEICRRQFSKYACPACNVHYCSLTCFRSEGHSQCSESFYKKEVETGIRTESSRTAEERLKMMEMLKRFEEESAEIDEDQDDEEEDDQDELAGRMKNVDLDQVRPEDLWSMLTPEERTKFLKALEHPDGETTRRLLASQELDAARVDPWWDDPLVSDADEDKVEDQGRRKYGARPGTMQVPPGLVQRRREEGGSLVYNLCAICMAYAYVTRSLAVSPLSSLQKGADDCAECRRLLGEIVPFLTDNSSTDVFPSMQHAITAVWSRIGGSDGSATAAAAVDVLMRDTGVLMRPRIDDEEAGVLLALADMCRVFGARSGVGRKLVFYAGIALGLEREEMRAVCSACESARS